MLIRQDLQDEQDLFCLSWRKAKSAITLSSKFCSAKAGLIFTLSSGKSENKKSEKSR